jgi:hypothetical protein
MSGKPVKTVTRVEQYDKDDNLVSQQTTVVADTTPRENEPETGFYL